MDILSVYIVISLFHSILLQQGPISFMTFVQSSYLMEILYSCKEIIGYVITANFGASHDSCHDMIKILL